MPFVKQAVTVVRVRGESCWKPQEGPDDGVDGTIGAERAIEELQRPVERNGDGEEVCLM